MQIVKISDWFFELGVSRCGLPYELPYVFSDGNLDLLKKSLEGAIGHLERTLDFRMYLHIEEGDLDDRWSELLVRLDACSYYAALAIPFARQVIEGKGGVDGKSSRGVFCGSMEFNFNIDGKERIIVAAEMIANKFSQLSDSYEALQAADEFAEWCVYFLQAAAVLILLATSQLSIPKGIRGPV